MSSEESFARGELVRLNSGGPVMIVPEMERKTVRRKSFES